MSPKATLIPRICAVILTVMMSAAAATGLATAQEGEFRQIELTEPMVLNFIKAQQQIKSRADEIEAAGEDEAKIVALLTDVAKSNGFSSFEELDVVAANVTLTMAGVDPETGTYTDPKESMRQELQAIEADKTLAAEERERLVAELEEAIEATPDLQYAGNVELIKKHAAEIEAVLE